MGNSCLSFLGRLFGEKNDDLIQAPLPATCYQSRSSSTSDHAHKPLPLRRPASSSAQFNTAHDHITQQFPNFSNLQSSLILESRNRPSPIFVNEQFTARKLNSATDAVHKSTCQASSSISHVPPFEKRESSSLDRRNDNLAVGKRPMESSFTGTVSTSVPSFRDLQKLNPASHSAQKSIQVSASMLPVPPSQTVSKPDTEKRGSSSFVQTYINLPSSEKTLEGLGNVALGKKGQTNFSSNSSSLISDTSSSSPDSSPLFPIKADVEKVMTSDSPKQSTGTNSKFILRVKSKILPANNSSNSSLLDEPTFSPPALKPKVTLPVFKVPDNLEHELENGKIPRILLTSLSIFTYREYFTALMYAEDYYCQKWSDYLLEDVALDIRENLISNKNKKVIGHDYQSPNIGKKEKFVVFEIDSIRERRPFLLSRDFVHLKPLHKHKQFKSFDGIVLRVANRSFVHTKFGDDFYSQHTPTSKYDVSFSFNRVCLKRCHLAINAITDFTFNSFLFPDHSIRILDTDQDQETFSFYNYALNYKEKVAVQHILNLWCPPPYLLVGPLAISMPSSNTNSSPFELSTTGRVVREAILRICRADTESRLLIATPRNKTCDVIMQDLTNHIPARQLFRANAAFRGVEDVPDDILDLTTYNPAEECFAMTDLPDLLKFRVISTTFMSSFRLYNEGVKAGHFSHVFLVDASSAIEPEVLVPLVNLVDDMTVVVVTGAMGDCPHTIRSDISQKYGLKISYFERLLRSSLYSSKDPSFVSYL